MKDKDLPIVHIPTLRRDLYLVMSLLLADKEVNKLPNAVDWTQDFYETEVRRLLIWIATAVRGLLDLPQGDRNIKNQVCGEYWPEFINQQKPEGLTFRQACNSVIHAKEILTYKIQAKEPDKTVTLVYENRITIKSTNKRMKTHAHLDIIRFVQIADVLINSFEGSNHADK